MVLLGKHGLLDCIRLNLRYSDWCRGHPFQWNDAKNYLDLKNQKKLNVYSVRVGLAALYFILALIQVIQVFPNSSLMVITHSVMFLAAGFLTLSSHVVNYMSRSEAVQLCNAFIKYEKRYTMEFAHAKGTCTRKTNTTDLFLKSMMYLLTSTAISVSAMYHLDIFRNPCFPLYVGFWMSGQCQNDKPGYYLEATWSLVEVGTKVGISVLSYLNWSLLLSGSNFETSLEYIMEGHCFRTYVTDFGE